MTSTQFSSVLVVEDDQDIRDILRMSLETMGGLSVTICSSGADAIETLNGELPDLMLLDWMMPHLDGSEVLEQIRSVTRTAVLPVVILTGKALPKEIDKMLALGATDVISKPFDPITLASRLAKIHASVSRCPSSDELGVLT